MFRWLSHVSVQAAIRHCRAHLASAPPFFSIITSTHNYLQTFGILKMRRACVHVADQSMGSKYGVRALRFAGSHQLLAILSGVTPALHSLLNAQRLAMPIIAKAAFLAWVACTSSQLSSPKDFQPCASFSQPEERCLGDELPQLNMPPYECNAALV